MRGVLDVTRQVPPLCTAPSLCVSGDRITMCSCRAATIWCWLAGLSLGSILNTGCGTTQSQLATQQLLLSDAVDRAVSRIDFLPLSGHSVFLDDRYVQTLRSQGVGFVNADYIVSSLRQQMLAAQCQLQDRADTADFVVEVRIGALGMDGHEVTYGIPPNSPLNSAVSVVPNTPNLPSIPEIALAKRNDQLAAAKVAVFAYDRETRTPVWQSGTSVALSDAKNVWVLGAGPFQRGSIYNGTRFAGSKLNIPLANSRGDLVGEAEPEDEVASVSYGEAYTFGDSQGHDEPDDEGLQPAGSEVNLSQFSEEVKSEPDSKDTESPVENEP
jgi:hypothetical protein